MNFFSQSNVSMVSKEIVFLPAPYSCGNTTGSMIFSCGIRTGELMGDAKLDLLQGTLDLMVLQTLETMGSLHGYGIARRIEQVSGNEVLLNQGTIYASLVRLQQRGWIDAKWGTSDNNRKAKFYSITKHGRKQLSEDAAHWRRLSSVMKRVLTMREEEGEL
jgi:transcriptional regulator